LAVRQQVEIFGGDQVSLSSLWRAVGSPEGKDPERWVEVAAPLLSGFAAYLDRLESFGGSSWSSDSARSVWIWEDESKDPWLTGDLMSHELIAWVYASHLDKHRERSNSRLTDSLAAK